MDKYIAIIICIILSFLTGCSSQPKVVVCIGNSLTACGGENGRYSDWLSQFLPQYQIINKGINGDTLAEGRARFGKDVEELKPDVVIIELGANDFWQHERNIKQLQEDLVDMVKRAKAAGMEVVIASCFGQRKYEEEENVEFNAKQCDFASAIGQMEQDVCQTYSCFYVPNMQLDIKPNGNPVYWNDTNHPNKSGNELVAKRILPALKKALKK